MLNIDIMEQTFHKIESSHYNAINALHTLTFNANHIMQLDITTSNLGYYTRLLTLLNDNILNYMNSINQLKTKCSNKIDTIMRFNIPASSSTIQYVAKNSSGYMELVQQEDTTTQEIKHINNIPIPPIHMPIVTNITDIKPAIYYWTGDTTYPSGLYISIYEGCYIQIPFPNVIDGTKNNTREGSIQCKYKTIKQCVEARKALSAKYQTNIRPCNFAHAGDRYLKIGTNYRCPSNPSLGYHNTFCEDIHKVNMSDIRVMLMYSLSDLLISTIWCQNQNVTGLLTDIDICNI